jgi:hypothetical protein
MAFSAVNVVLIKAPYPTFPREKAPHLNPLPLAGEEANVKDNLQFLREKEQS